MFGYVLASIVMGAICTAILFIISMILYCVFSFASEHRPSIESSGLTIASQIIVLIIMSMFSLGAFELATSHSHKASVTMGIKAVLGDRYSEVKHLHIYPKTNTAEWSTYDGSKRIDITLKYSLKNGDFSWTSIENDEVNIVIPDQGSDSFMGIVKKKPEAKDAKSKIPESGPGKNLED